jgi:hypothetical protein
VLNVFPPNSFAPTQPSLTFLRAEFQQGKSSRSHTSRRQKRLLARSTSHVILFVCALHCLNTIATAQNTVTGAFQGIVTDSQSGSRLRGAVVEIINQQSGITYRLRTNYRGTFFQGLLLPGTYTVRVSLSGYQTKEISQLLRITYTGEVVPVPVALDPGTTVAAPTAAAPSAEDNDVRASIVTTDARHTGSFTEKEAVTLPLGGTTVTRTFDELALLLPGVAPPPQTIGNVAGPGVGPGVGSAGQFATNGLRSRGNNFTVDGSDNNDEDIGVRRQGFVALIPQPIESIQEYHVTTLLAPAQFGRNIGGQVNAVSKSGGDKTHGTIYGTFNSSQLNARNFFDDGVNDTHQLLSQGNQPVLLNGNPLFVTNESGGEDSFTFGQGGFVLGGPITKRLFYFVSAETYTINATEEHDFAVPTIEQRGAFGTGATGIFANPFTGLPALAIPSSQAGSAVFSLFPFPNNPTGVYGANTFTQVLPASGRGTVLSGKLDQNFLLSGKEQSFTSRYNFTNDWRILPITDDAIFSTIKPRVRTQNLSLFLNSRLSGKESSKEIFNQVRLSYGRTRLKFEEVRDQQFLIPSRTHPDIPFLLNARSRFNVTQPPAAGVPNTGPINLIGPILIGNATISTVEEELGSIGQVNIAGFSSLGVDVFNFPQRRVNNTYQLADELTLRTGDHNFVFGVDTRRSELNSDIPRNARPLVTFNGAPRLIPDAGGFRLPTASDPNPIISPQDLAGLGAASNFFLTMNTERADANIDLRFYQLDFYAQYNWQVRSNVSLSLGLRYEYNTPVSESHGLIEDTFNDPSLSLVPGLRQFIDGRTRIYEPDRNNFAPRLGLVYLTRLGPERVTVVRAGYGLFYDQVLGAVVSQSRNVFPTFLTLNFGGIAASVQPVGLTLSNPGRQFFVVGNDLVPLQVPGSLNRYNPALPLSEFFNFINVFFPSALAATLPSRTLEMPMAHHYSVTVEQQLNSNSLVAVSYVGTVGRHLLRFTTPNLGPSSTVTATAIVPFQLTTLQGVFQIPEAFGLVRSPNRPVKGIGSVINFETSATSSYHALQLETRGRFQRALNYQATYTLSASRDDVSDVFDLAGASELPQNSITFSGEYGPANFDVRHRFTSNLTYDFPAPAKGSVWRLLLSGLQMSGSSQFQTSQPFTVNSVIDVNLDGNLTDRLDTTAGLLVTGDRRQPLQLTTSNTTSLLAPFGQDGRIDRNTFRAGHLLSTNLSILKRVSLRGDRALILRADFFNFINHANFGVPRRFLEAPAFGQATSTVTPGRRIQLGVKYSF